MHEFKHPKYYKELRKRNKLDQAISNAEATAASERATGPGHKQRDSTGGVPGEADISVTSVKLQAASDKLHNKFSLIKFHASRSEVLYHDKCVQRMAHMEGNLMW